MSPAGIERGRKKGELSPSSLVLEGIGGIITAKGDVIDLENLENDKRIWAGKAHLPKEYLKRALVRFMPFKIIGSGETVLIVKWAKAPKKSTQDFNLTFAPKTGKIKVEPNFDSDVALENSEISSSSLAANLANFHLEIFFKPQDSLVDIE